MLEFKPVEGLPLGDHVPEGWLGDPEEWPIVFLLDHEATVFNGSLAFFEQQRPDWRDRLVPNTAYAYCTVCDYGEYDLEFVLLSALPDVGRRENHYTWLEAEYGMVGGSNDFWQMAFMEDAWNHGEDPITSWAMHEGLCPDQWFVVKMTPWYHGPDYNGEYDNGVHAKIISSEKLSPAEHLQRWTDFLKDREDR